jgi:hypothetical protein
VVMGRRKDCCWKQDAGHGSCNAAGLRVKKGGEEEAAARSASDAVSLQGRLARGARSERRRIE